MKQIELTQGEYAIVDDEDFEEMNKFKWHYAGGYARRNKKLSSGKRGMEFLHRLVAKTPENMYTDHINGNTLDNRRSNLRNVTRSQNAKNARKKAESTSKYKGVSYFKRDADSIGKWMAKIQVDGEVKKLGYFNSEIEAAIAYNDAAKKHHGEYAVLNVVKKMDMYEYQKRASRTIPKEKWFATKASNFCMGLSGEVGEVVDEMKKVLYHGHDLNREEMEKELGDVLWYLTSLASIMNMDLSEIAEKNIIKLEKRYPNGFKEKDSIQRRV
jgi:NTP pyrophosphatase (non-canonical NTP hydrolase)